MYGRCEEDGEEEPVDYWWLLQPRKLGAQLGLVVNKDSAGLYTRPLGAASVPD